MYKSSNTCYIETAFINLCLYLPLEPHKAIHQELIVIAGMAVNDSNAISAFAVSLYYPKPWVHGYNVCIRQFIHRHRPTKAAVRVTYQFS
jgi:hypothetical protein